MLTQFASIEICVAALGILLIINGALSMIFPGYYRFFAKSYIVERLSNADRERLKVKLQSNHDKSRYATSVFVILLGVSATAWALGWKVMLGWPFSLLF